MHLLGLRKVYNELGGFFKTMAKVEEILKSNDPVRLKSLFAFNSSHSNEIIIEKFNLFGRKYFPKYFSKPDAYFHAETDLETLRVYRGEIDGFVDAGFRGAAKTARKKVFRTFVICCDQDHFRRYLKVESEDLDNAKQIVTDVYNMLIHPPVRAIWPEVFEKTETKREERMDSFTTSTGVKLVAMSVSVSQRGAIQEESRPDEIWFEDFENRTTLRSNRKTKVIWENMEEARTGLAKKGGCVYTCNYVSEQGNVDRLVKKKGPRFHVHIQSILKDDGTSAWPEMYSMADIEYMRATDEDFEGERLSKPSAARDILFDREKVDEQKDKLPIRESAGFKMYYKFDPSHRYASGHDVAGGVGLDSSTSVFIDFDTVPARVVATFMNNTIKPDTFGDEVRRESDFFGGCIAAVEKNNHGHTTIARLKQLEQAMYYTQPNDAKTEAARQSNTPKEYGWHTNGLTKPKMLFAFAKAVEDGLIELNDPTLIAECRSYTRNDLIETIIDPRETTRHFDMLVAACIAWQMKDFATVMEIPEEVEEEEEQVNYPDIWGKKR